MNSINSEIEMNDTEALVQLGPKQNRIIPMKTFPNIDINTDDSKIVEIGMSRHQNNPNDACASCMPDTFTFLGDGTMRAQPREADPSGNTEASAVYSVNSKHS